MVYLLEPDGIIKKSYPDMESLPDKEDFLIGKSYDDLIINYICLFDYLFISS